MSIIRYKYNKGIVDTSEEGNLDKLLSEVEVFVRDLGEDKEYIESFFDQYGITEIDYKKIRLYEVVEHLVWA